MDESRSTGTQVPLARGREDEVDYPRLGCLLTIGASGRVPQRRGSRGVPRVLLRGHAYNPITGVRLIDCTLDNVAQPDPVDRVEGLVQENVRVSGTPR
jgi:hypothetical protein